MRNFYFCFYLSFFADDIIMSSSVICIERLFLVKPVCQLVSVVSQGISIIDQSVDWVGNSITVA